MVADHDHPRRDLDREALFSLSSLVGREEASSNTNRAKLNVSLPPSLRLGSSVDRRPNRVNTLTMLSLPARSLLLPHGRSIQSLPTNKNKVPTTLLRMYVLLVEKILEEPGVKTGSGIRGMSPDEWIVWLLTHREGGAFLILDPPGPMKNDRSWTRCHLDATHGLKASLHLLPSQHADSLFLLFALPLHRLIIADWPPTC